MAKQVSRRAGGYGKAKLYIGIGKENDRILGHTVSVGTPVAFDETSERVAYLEHHEGIDDLSSNVKTGFKRVFYQFRNSIEVYRSFIPLMLSVGHKLSSSMMELEIQGFAEKNGKLMPHLNTDNTVFYELEAECLREYRQVESRMRSATIGMKHLPEVSIVGLISAYDAFLSQLLKEVFTKNEGMVLTEEKSITYGELKDFSSLLDVKSAIVSKAVETMMRESHDEQFRQMEAKFAITLTKNLELWPEFIELCERRNLLTHTGGLVSAQYIQKCRANNVDVSKRFIGEKLGIDPQYYARSVAVIYELGVSLCSVLWRKFAKDEIESADQALNDVTFNLISERDYSAAEALLRFGVYTLKTHSSDSARRIMIVNLANAIRLQDRQDEANNILDSHDWSACDAAYQICVEAVKGNVNSVVEQMRRIGNNSRPTMHEYRTWPVFRGLHTEVEFLDVFSEVFGEPFNEPTVVAVDHVNNSRSKKAGTKSRSQPTKKPVRKMRTRTSSADKKARLH